MSAHPRSGMCAFERARKEGQIAKLPAGELEGWDRQAAADGYFDGEQAAITARAKALSVDPRAWGHRMKSNQKRGN
jgi:hypothetical protein